MDVMELRRNVIAGLGAPLLPPAYQQVEYLGTNGYQRIDVPYIPIDGDAFSLNFMITTYPARNKFSCLVATKNEDPQMQFVFGFESARKTLFYKYFSTGDASRAYVDFQVGILYHATVDEHGVLSIGGTTCAPVNNLGYATGPLRFFERSTGGINYIGRLYGFSASHNGATTLNLIPCYRKSDNEAGLFDTVTKSFYANGGANSLIIGPVV